MQTRDKMALPFFFFRENVNNITQKKRFYNLKGSFPRKLQG